MFIIFGWEKTVRPLESLITTNCYHCDNVSSWSLWKETQWLSLFFIKVLPFSSKHHLCCDICSNSVPLNNSLATSTLSKSNRNEALHAELLSKIEQHQFVGLTEGQISFKKAQSRNANV